MRAARVRGEHYLLAITLAYYVNYSPTRMSKLVFIKIIAKFYLWKL